MNLKSFIKRVLLRRKPVPAKKKGSAYYDFIEPDAFFDVGANIGMSAEYYLGLNYNVPVYSFEPVSHLFQELNLKAGSNANWHAFNVGVGEAPDKLNINVSGGHGGASSFLEMTEEFKSIAPDQKVNKTELVDIITLSDFYKQHNLVHERIFLKLDVQGFELNVLRGSSSMLDNVIGLKVEVSIKKQYHNDLDIFATLPYILNLGFCVYAVEEAWRNPVTKELLQIDIYLFKPSRVNYK